MITFLNPQNIDLVESFVNQFGEIINEKYSHQTISIFLINEQHQLFNAVANETDPFATNKIMQPPCIAVNHRICRQLELTKQEQYAMIAHEIGHILDDSPRDADNQLPREFAADDFVIYLNLSNALKNGLEKIIESGDYPNEANSIKERISKMTN